MRKIFNTVRNRFRRSLHFIRLNYLARPGSVQDGYNVFGYFSKFIGQGEIARGFVDELIRNGEKCVLIDFFNYTHERITRQEEYKYRKYYFKKYRYRTNIFFVDLLALQQIRKLIPVLFRNRKNIVTFWWEFENGFEERIPILNEFDEVYVFSDFIKDVLNSVESRTFKVTKIKYTLIKNWVIEDEPLTIKRRYHQEGRFCFFFNFDYLSSYSRKNPEAILTALAEEFPNEEQVVLFLKTNNSVRFEEKESRFLNLVKTLGLSDRVVIIRESLTRNEFMTLLNAMDCYISLHRGEGLGLGIQEALALGKPVIATNYGGNSEFMNHPLAMPVSYSLVPASDDYHPYRNVKTWAEPDINAARSFMRKIFKEKMVKPG